MPDTTVARYFKDNDFYDFLEGMNVKWNNVISRKIFPENAILIINRALLFIIEFKWHNESVENDDEELMLCDYNRKQYMKLVAPLGLKVEYVYILNDWFKKPEYKDVLDYINSVNCHYKFNELPLSWLGLPTR